MPVGLSVATCTVGIIVIKLCYNSYKSKSQVELYNAIHIYISIISGGNAMRRKKSLTLIFALMLSTTLILAENFPL